MCKSGFGGLAAATGNYEYKIGPTFEAGSYVCGKKVTSHKAGTSCSDGSQCVSSEGHIFAKCDCSQGSSSKVCGILPGNAEWQDYFKAVKKYYSATKDCHNARNFEGVCNQDHLNDEKNCMKATAKNYIYYSGAPSCVKFYSNRYLFPEVDEVEYWCNDQRKYLVSIPQLESLNIS